MLRHKAKHLHPFLALAIHTTGQSIQAETLGIFFATLKIMDAALQFLDVFLICCTYGRKVVFVIAHGFCVWPTI